ncbi:MAG: hypothetical protein JWM78_371 [Verrucomicrobiaceae bacterium]|nr:hypothetical protein [Verrucomicrobiaceae bacterium]
MRYAVFALLLSGASFAGAAVDVDFVNASKATRCAEEDNVYVKLFGDGIKSFHIRAEHPVYIGSIAADSTAPDFTHCDMSHDASFPFTPRTVTLYEDANIRLVGHTYATFWRPDVVDFRVGARSEPGLHLVQLLRRRAQGDVEMLVVYPADGYWRAKPLPPAGLPDTAYGSSFLFGPIEEGIRPFVAIRRITFEPSTLTFRLEFKNEARGILAVSSATSVGLDLSVAIEPALAADRPFAALRSMFVGPEQADVAVANWPEQSANRRSSILEFSGARAPLARFERVLPSHHNLSAPDVIFDQFATE